MADEDDTSYNEEQGGYAVDYTAEMPDVEDIAGACPPLLKWYRIYPETDFTAVFASPPDNVIT